MTSLSDLEILVIERACEKLIYAFFEAIDLRNDRDLEHLFTEDATYARPIDPATIISGREELIKMFAARPVAPCRATSVRMCASLSTRLRALTASAVSC